MPVRFELTAFFVAFSLSCVSAFAQDADPILERIKLPPGFKISVFAEAPSVRSMTVCKPLNTIYAGTRDGSVYAIQDKNRDGKADTLVEKAKELKVPNGIACRNSRVYLALQDKVVMWPVPAEFDLSIPFEPLLPIFEPLPDHFLHGWRYAKFGPDDKLYVSVGSPCNICETKGYEGTIIRMNPDGSDVEIVAKGVRNSVGFDWHPVTKELFFTDNGADDMGDTIPPDELNHVTEAGQFFGFPYLGGKDVKLTGFEDKKPPENPVAPVIAFEAHSANLGIHFYTGDQFPDEYKNDAFVAQHGSWNRSTPIGYRIMRVKFDEDGNATGKEVFAEGWLQGDDAIGRPVDITELPDGSLIISDDFAGRIYRISYDG